MEVALMMGIVLAGVVIGYFLGHSSATHTYMVELASFSKMVEHAKTQSLVSIKYWREKAEGKNPEPPVGLLIG